MATVLLLRQGVATSSSAFDPGSVVEWPSDAEAERFIQRGIAVLAEDDETSAAKRQRRFFRYTPPVQNDQDVQRAGLRPTHEYGALANEND